MDTPIVHHARVAWDAAVALTRAAAADEAVYFWTRNWVADLLGQKAALAMTATRDRLTDPMSDPGNAQVEIGRWRAHLEGELRVRPDIGTFLRDRVAQTSILMSTGTLSQVPRTFEDRNPPA